MASGGALYLPMAAHADALACHQALARLRPGQPEALRGLASAETASGRLVEAEAHLDQAIAADPREADGWYNRSILRRQSPEWNHVGGLAPAFLAGAVGP